MDLDELVVQVKTESDNATDSLEELIKTLSKLKTSLNVGTRFSSLSDNLGKISTAAENLGNAGSKITELAKGLEQLSSVSKTKLSSSIANQLTEIGAAVDLIKDVNFSTFSDLANGLQALSEVGKVKISSSISNQLVEIGTALDICKDVDFGKFNDLANGLNALANVGKVSLSSSISTTIESLGRAISGLDTSKFSALGELAEALSSLSELPKINVSSIAKGLERLAAIDLSEFESQIQELTEIMQPFAEEMQSVADGFSSFPTRIQQLIRQENNLTTSTNNVNNKLSKFISLLNVAGAMTIIKKVTSTIAGWISKSNDYIEDLNLFNAALGEYADEARTYAEEVSNVMGIDTGEWMRNQGVFMTLTTGFGVASDKAYKMSKNLTQLGYDIASYFNLSIEESMQKLESAIAGELEPVRRIGYDLSKAALEGIIMDTDNYTVSMENLSNAMSDEAMSAFAAAQGFNLNYSEMTQAEKSQLRYIALMTQVTNVQGDMARTLNSPANQLRILKSQIQMCARALGNIFIPVLNKVLPILISLAKVIRLVANTIANIFGFEIPEVDYSGLGATVSDTTDDITDYYDAAEDGADSASAAAEEYKNTLLGFDEPNRLNDTSSSSSSGSGSGSSWDSSGLGSSFDFDLPEYNFLDAINERVDELYEKLKEILGLGEDIESNWKNLKIAIDDVFFSWEDLTGEQIAEKCVTGLETLLGGATGFALAGIPGALVGSLTGAALSLVFDSFNFNHDGTLDSDEVGRAMANILNEVVAGAAGYLLFGSVKGGLISASLAGLLTVGFQKFELEKGDGLSSDTHTILYTIKKILNTIAPAAIGFKIGGLKGATIAMGVSALLELALTSIFPTLDDNTSIDNEFIASLVNIMNQASIVALGFEVGGTGGGAIALVADLILQLSLADIEFQGWKAFSTKTWSEYTPEEKIEVDAVSSASFNSSKFEEALKEYGYDLSENVSTGFDNGVSDNFTDEKLDEDFLDKMRGLYDRIVAFLGIGSPSKLFYDVGTDTVQGLFNGFEDKWNEFETQTKSWFDSFKSWWEGRKLNGWHISLPHISISYTAASSWVSKILGITQIPHLSVSWYKNGGFPDVGEMFVAREAGPELVGNIGNRSAVANNDQIIEGIKQGVYEAMVSANSSGKQSNSGSVTLSVNGKQFCRAIYNDMKSVTKEHGISLVNA